MNTRLFLGFSSVIGFAAGCGGGVSMSYYEAHPRHHRAVIVEQPPPVIVEERPVVVARPGVIVERPAVIVDERPRAVRVEEPPRRVVEGYVGPGGGEVRVFDRHRNIWINIERGHVHGPHCGHVFVHGRWEVR